MRARIQPGRCHSIVLCAAGFLFWASGAARAEDASSWRDIETKYIFGFTTGSGIGLEGEKEFTVDSIGRFGKRDGHYAATETKYEFEFTPTQFIQIEFGALGSTHHIGGVTDLDDRLVKLDETHGCGFAPTVIDFAIAKNRMQRVLGKDMFDVSDQKFLMLLFVMNTQGDERRDFSQKLFVRGGKEVGNV